MMSENGVSGAGVPASRLSNGVVPALIFVIGDQVWPAAGHLALREHHLI